MKKKISIVISLLLLLILIPTTVQASETYVVKSGDRLWKIAREYNLEWKDLAEYNKLDNPNLIFVNQKIEIPDAKNLENKEEKEIVLLETSDLHGRIYSYDYAVDEKDSDAGLAKVATIVKKERAENDNVILIDCGDSMQDNSAELFNNQDVHPMIEGLNVLNYDVWTLGNHEFNYGLDFLNKNIKAFEGKVLSANIKTTNGDYYVKPNTIIEKDGVRVAIIGLTPPEIPRWEGSTPDHYKDLEFNQDTVAVAKKQIKELEGKYDVLVGAFHLGKEGEYGYLGADAIAKACPEFDVIFMGHEHSKYNYEVNGVKMLEPGKYGNQVAKADIILKADKYGNYEVMDITTDSLKTAEVEEDEAFLNEFEYVHKKSIENANEIVGQVSADFIDGTDYITKEDVVTTMPTSQIQDNAVADLICEVETFYSKADVASTAIFKVNQNLKKGDFKRKDVANIYKYSNTLVGTNITGENLMKYLEWSAQFYNTAKEGDITVSFNPEIRGYNYDEFSGMNYKIDLSKEAGKRVVDVTINDKPLDPMATYKLAINNYRFGTLTSLGLVTTDDKYYDSFEVLADEGRIRDLIIKYVQEELNGVVAPKVDNNWSLKWKAYDGKYSEQAIMDVNSGKIKIPTSEDGRTFNIKSVNVLDLIEQGYFK